MTTTVLTVITIVVGVFLIVGIVTVSVSEHKLAMARIKQTNNVYITVEVADEPEEELTLPGLNFMDLEKATSQEIYDYVQATLRQAGVIPNGRRSTLEQELAFFIYGVPFDDDYHEIKSKEKPKVKFRGLAVGDEVRLLEPFYRGKYRGRVATVVDIDPTSTYPFSVKIEGFMGALGMSHKDIEKV